MLVGCREGCWDVFVFRIAEMGGQTSHLGGAEEMEEKDEEDEDEDDDDEDVSYGDSGNDVDEEAEEGEEGEEGDQVTVGSVFFSLSIVSQITASSMIL